MVSAKWVWILVFVFWGIAGAIALTSKKEIGRVDYGMLWFMVLILIAEHVFWMRRVVWMI